MPVTTTACARRGVPGAAGAPELAVDLDLPFGVSAPTATPGLPTSDSAPTAARLRFDQWIMSSVSAVSNTTAAATATAPHGEGARRSRAAARRGSPRREPRRSAPRPAVRRGCSRPGRDTPRARHLLARAELDDPRIAAGRSEKRGATSAKRWCTTSFDRSSASASLVRVQVTALAERDQLLGERPDGLRLRLGGLDPAVLDHARPRGSSRAPCGGPSPGPASCRRA